MLFSFRQQGKIINNATVYLFILSNYKLWTSIVVCLYIEYNIECVVFVAGEKNGMRIEISDEWNIYRPLIKFIPLLHCSRTNKVKRQDLVKMASIPTEELSSFANNLADEARKIILPYWRKPIDIISKIEHDRPIAESPVTIADQLAEKCMRKLIEERYPTHGIYGEEFGQVRTDAEYVW